MIEATLDVDSFRRNKTLTGDEAYLRQIYNLIVMKPGTDPLNPDKGCDMNSFYYRLSDSAELRRLEQNIRDQVSSYLGYYVQTVSAKPLKVGNKLVLHCFISAGPAEGKMLVSTNGLTAQFSRIKNLSEQIN